VVVVESLLAGLVMCGATVHAPPAVPSVCLNQRAALDVAKNAISRPRYQSQQMPFGCQTLGNTVQAQVITIHKVVEDCVAAAVRLLSARQLHFVVLALAGSHRRGTSHHVVVAPFFRILLGARAAVSMSAGELLNTKL